MSRPVDSNRSRRSLEKRGYWGWAEIAEKRRIKRAVREYKSSAIQPVPFVYPIGGRVVRAGVSMSVSRGPGVTHQARRL